MLERTVPAALEPTLGEAALHSQTADAGSSKCLPRGFLGQGEMLIGLFVVVFFFL